VAARKKKTRSRTHLTKANAQPPSKLSKTEEDLIWHMSHGYQLETSLRWDSPILRNLKDDTTVRATANRGTIEGLQRRGLIKIGREGGVVNPTVWRLASEGK
jgi:hypothetical protein